MNTPTIPPDAPEEHIKTLSWRETLPKDFISGLVVALVALPLCLGIALASGQAPITGLMAGIVGGLIISWISGSKTSVSGPAAGLTAVVINQVTTLGSFEIFLAAVVIAGVLQIILGLLKAGALARFFPESVIRGLLAAIGVILIMKQLPHLFGYTSETLAKFGLDTLLDVHLSATLIGAFSVALLFIWPRTPLKSFILPAPLFVVVFAVFLSLGFNTLGGAWLIEPSHLVNVPLADSVGELFGQLARPNWDAIGQVDLWIAAVTICVVASLETLLNLEAVDKLDPKRRHSPPNRELIAQGAGNIAGGLLGALPVTSVIVRSSVNVASGVETRMASFIHGIFLVTTLIFIPDILNMIPLSCLAAILIITGFKLASPSLFMTMWRGGYQQLIPFIVTLITIVMTDLLVGIITGLIVAFAIDRMSTKASGH